MSLEGVLKLPISGERSQIKTMDMGSHFIPAIPRLSEIDALSFLLNPGLVLHLLNPAGVLVIEIYQH